MKNQNTLLHWLSNIQILSALTWAVTIIACSFVSDKSSISIILITAGGFHVVLMSSFMKRRATADIA